ncbi:MAG: metal-dependent hydrolase [Nanobdellota archaeon]
MRYETHAITALILSFLFNFTLLQGVVAILASLLPDIDTAESWLGKRFKPLSWLLRIGLTHRGPIHSILVMGICAAVIFLYAPAFTLPFIVGYASHLILDSLNPKGTTLFWPFRYKLKGFIRNGSIMEYLLLAALTTGFLLKHWT